MSNTKYTFDIDQFLNNKVDLTKLDTEIKSSAITVSLDYISSTEVACDCFFKSVLPSKDLTTLSGIVAVHDGVDDELDDVTYVSIKSSSISIPVDIRDEFRDRSGKLRVHQTSRKLGTVIVWTGVGDDLSDATSVGGGEFSSFFHVKGEITPLIKYIDFNIVENETWLHEGYVTWKNCYLDTVDFKVVSSTTSYTTSSGTDLALNPCGLIMPVASGTGDVIITSDITESTGGLVYMPLNDIGECQFGFWDAVWDIETKKFTDITPKPFGDGFYNLFYKEVVFAHFIRKLPLLNSGSMVLNSSDTDELGHGMRIKIAANTNVTVSGVGDHDWSMASTLCLHRKKTV